MKKNFKIAASICLSIFLFSSCTKEEAAPQVAKITYVTDIKPIIVANCTPCHLSGGGNPNKWDDYLQAKNKIASILDRIQREPGTAGAMPNGAKTKLSTETINKFKQWVTDGTLEK